MKEQQDLKETFSALIQSKLDNLDYLIELKLKEVELMKEHRKGLIQHLIKNKIE